MFLFLNQQKSVETLVKKKKKQDLQYMRTYSSEKSRHLWCKKLKDELQSYLCYRTLDLPALCFLGTEVVQQE